MLAVTTDSVMPHDRQAFWTDVVCAHLVQADCECAEAGEPFAGHIDHWRLAPASPDGNESPQAAFSVSRIRSQAQRVRRTWRHIAAAVQEQVLVNVQRRGQGVVRQDGRTAVLTPGDLAVYTSDRPYELAFDATFEQTVLIFPADVVRRRVPDLGRLTARRISAGTPAADLLCEAAQRVVLGMPQSTHPHLAQALVALLAATLAQHPAQAPTTLARCPVAPTGDAGRARPEGLSRREAQVLHLVARGMTYQDIARHLALSITTVRSHVRGLYAKLGAHNKTEAVFEARLSGWLE